MKQDQEDQIRIQFAERLGWKVKQSPNKEKGYFSMYSPEGIEYIDMYCPDSTSHSDVHNALMGMTNEEWDRFSRNVWGKLKGIEYPPKVIEGTLKLSLSILITCFLEATKNRGSYFS